LRLSRPNVGYIASGGICIRLGVPEHGRIAPHRSRLDFSRIEHLNISGGRLLFLFHMRCCGLDFSFDVHHHIGDGRLFLLLRGRGSCDYGEATAQ
jgi:hypothetical protein